MYRIVSHEHPTLHRKAEAVPTAEITSARIKKLIRAMKELLAKEDLGVALAAPQVGEPLRIFVVSGKVFMEHDDAGKPVGETFPDMVFVNPEILRIARTKKEKHEGCLSLRGWWGMVPRAERVSVRAYNENGAPFTRNASGLLAHIVQHEMDHLEGVLYTEKAKELYEDTPEQS